MQALKLRMHDSVFLGYWAFLREVQAAVSRRAAPLQFLPRGGCADEHNPSDPGSLHDALLALAGFRDAEHGDRPFDTDWM
ncbi:hypothetical protein ABID95_008061 [Streptomyces atratus]